MTHFFCVLLFSTCVMACAAEKHGDITCQACKPCSPGFAKGITSDKPCLECLPGYWQPDFGAEKCLTCPLGTYMVGKQEKPYDKIMECAQCPAGKYSPNGGACQTCRAGAWADKEGMSECSTCDPGHVIVETDPNPALSKTCKTCGVGTSPALGKWQGPSGTTEDYDPSWNVSLSIHAATGGWACKECADKSWLSAANEGQKTCSFCLLGQSIVGYNGSGSYDKTAEQTCEAVKCPSGQIYDTYWGQCLELRDGHTPNPSGMGYHGSSYGHFSVNGTLQPCPEGTYSRPTLNKCVACPAGKSVNNAKSGCIADTMPSCAEGEVPMGGLADQNCLLRQILTDNDAMYGTMTACEWLFAQYSGLTQYVNTGNQTHPNWIYKPEGICPIGFEQASLATLAYRYCPATMKAAFNSSCAGSEKEPVDKVILKDSRATLMLYKDMWNFGFQGASWGVVGKNMDAGKYPVKDSKGMFKDEAELTEWWDLWTDCSDQPEMVKHNCKSWYFLIACPTTCATQVFGTMEEPRYFLPGELTDFCDSKYAMPFYMGYVTPLTGFSATFQMLTEEIKDCAYENVDTKWNMETGLQDAICLPEPSVESSSTKPMGKALSDQYCATIPVQEKVVCDKGHEAGEGVVCKVTCSKLKDHFQKYECCGEYEKPAGDSTCDAVRKVYRDSSCCGNPAKHIVKPAWLPYP